MEGDLIDPVRGERILGACMHALLYYRAYLLPYLRIIAYSN